MTESVQTIIDLEGNCDSVSVAVVFAIAEIEGIAPEKVDVCLFDYVDTNAIENLFDSSAPSLARCGTVSFLVDDYDITIDVNPDNTAEICVSSNATTIRRQDNDTDLADPNVNLSSV